METYCVKCRKKTKDLNSKIFKTKNGRLIMQSKCTECWFKNSRFVKEQEAKGLLSSLGIKTTLSKILMWNVLFWVYKDEWNCKQIFTGRWQIHATNAFKTTVLLIALVVYSLKTRKELNSLCKLEIKILFMYW